MDTGDQTPGSVWPYQGRLLPASWKMPERSVSFIIYFGNSCIACHANKISLNGIFAILASKEHCTFTSDQLDILIQIQTFPKAQNNVDWGVYVDWGGLDTIESQS